MEDLSTPRKRQATGQGIRSGLKRGAPAPNPPLSPFPTPSRSTARRPAHSSAIDVFSPDVAPSLSQPPALSQSHKPKEANILPPHLETLLTLHRAFALALSLHIATHPPILPPHAPSATSVKLPNLTNLVALRESIEQAGKRRFGVTELQRLAWLWSWDGEDPGALSAAGGANRTKDEDENPFLVKSPSDGSSDKLEVSGLSFLLTPTRTLDSASNRRVYTYGIGLVLALQPGETRQLLHGGSEGGLYNRGQGGGMGAIGRWNVAAEEREETVKARLLRWVELHGGYQGHVEHALSHSITLPTPANTKEGKEGHKIPPIPMLPLPPLPQATASLLPGANLFTSGTTSITVGGSGRNKAVGLGKGVPAISTIGPPKMLGRLADPFVLRDEDEEGESGKTGMAPGGNAKKDSVEARRQAMMDRIKARKAQKSNPPTLAGSIASGSARLGSAFSTAGLNKADTAEELKRRSTLSRLEGVAEAVWMMFSAPAQSTTSVTLTPPRGRRKAVPMAEAAEVIVKSSKTPISIAEAQTSLTLLTSLCPFFLQLKIIGRSEWLEMPPQALAIPSSPSSFSLSGSTGNLSGTLPRYSNLPTRHVPASPTTPRRNGSAGANEPVTPTTPTRSTPGRAALAVHALLTPTGGGAAVGPEFGARRLAFDDTDIGLSEQLLTPSPRSTAKLGHLSQGPTGSRSGSGSGSRLASPVAHSNLQAVMGMDTPLRRSEGGPGLLGGSAGVGMGSGGRGGETLALAGPASPGRVRRGGGLREVRERIRRELGE